LRLAGALQVPLNLWVAESHEPETPWAENLEGVAVDSVQQFSGASRRRKVFDEVKAASPTLLVVGKRAEEASDDVNRRFSADLFEQCSCQVLVVRIVEDLPAGEFKILVPCAGGPHSRTALKLSHGMVGKGTVAFQMRSDSDELSKEVGERHLEKIVRKAGLDFEEVGHEVVLGDHFPTALKQELGTEKYGMLLIGASDSGTLRRKLFGTLPERLLSKTGGMTVGVIRAEKSTGHRMRDAVGRMIQVNVPQLRRDERLALFDDVESKSRWSFDFAALMALATLIAGMGLLVNSGAVVIGAMLVAPLMMPLIGSGLALVQGNWPLCKRALCAVIRGFLVALMLGFGMGMVARFLDLGITEQLEMRGSPNVLDLGVALVSGIAASYCVARPKLSGALAGVAIAAALVPPIATVGICLALGAISIAKGAALLFGTNVVAVVLGAGVNFFLAGIRGKHRSGEWARRGLIVLALICAGLCVPLTSVLYAKLSRNAQVEEQIAKALPEDVKLRSVSRIEGNGYEVLVESSEVLDASVLEELKDVIGKDRKVRLKTQLVAE